MTNYFKTFVTSLNISDCRVCNFPSLIFLCGGSLESFQSKPKSARGFYIKHVEENNPELKTKFILAEAINDWYDENIYKDLLSFERDLASLSSLTVLFVESAGSIAELGAFSLLEPINKSLFAIIESDKSAERSFINLGPVRYIKNIREGSIHFYKWEIVTPKNGREIFFLSEDAIDLTERILNFHKSLPKELSFVPKNVGHVILFIADVINVLIISKLSEIQIILKSLGIPLKERILNRYVYILQKLGLVKKVSYSNNDYFVACKDTSYIRYSFQPQTSLRDMDKWRTFFQKEYEEHDPRKMRAYRSYLRSK